MRAKARNVAKDKNADVIYKDYQNVKKNKIWWEGWAKSFGYFLEEVEKGKKLIVRDGKTNNAIKTLTKV